ncbi:MAG: phosphonoacetaldehyde reductase [Clostridiales bacterium]|nr:phosphonoacetaldehyde reductase [Clostridiales bacterium]
MLHKGEILPSLKDIEKVSFKRPFLCCGKSFESTKAFEYLKNNYNLTIWDNIRPNPKFEDMIDAAGLFSDNRCDFIIGAGGGSALDSAKMIKLLSSNDKIVALTSPMSDNDIGFLAIPTTSGSGSEATRYSIFYVNENEKRSISNKGFLPDYVLLDESFIKTVPPYQRSSTAMDALCHAIESYWNVKSSDESKKFAEKAIRLFTENKAGYIDNSAKGNRGMLLSSYYAGKAINITSTTAAHAMCYNITMNCGVAHGHSVCSVLSELWDYMNLHNSAVNDSRGREYVVKTLNELGIMLGGKNSAEGALIFKSIMKEFKLEHPAAGLNNAAEFSKNIDPSRLLNNPTRLNEKDVFEIYKRVFYLL